MSRLALMFAGLLACNPEPPDACAGKLDAIRDLFGHGPADVVVLNSPPDMQLPTFRRGAPIDDGVPLFIHADGRFVFDNQVHADLAAVLPRLVEEFDKAGQFAANTGVASSLRLLLVADAHAPVSAIDGLADALPVGTRFVQIVDLAGDVVAPAPPRPPALQQALDAPADERAYALAGLLKPAIGACRPLADLFDAVSTTSADLRNKSIIDGFPEALAACKCTGVDVELVTAAVWALSGKTEISKRQVALALTREPAAESVELPLVYTFDELVGFAEGRGTAPFRLVRTAAK